MAFGRTLPPWFGRQTAPPVDPSIMGMLPQAQQFTAGQQIAPAAAPAPLVEQQGPSRADVARAQDVAGGVDTGYGLENVRDPWSALAYAVNKGVTGYAQGKAKRMGEEQKAADRKALAETLAKIDRGEAGIEALLQLDIPEVQDMMVQSKFAQMSKAPAEKWQDVDTNKDGLPDAQRNSITGEYKPIDNPLSYEQKLNLADRGASRTSVNVLPAEIGARMGMAEGFLDSYDSILRDLPSINTIRGRIELAANTGRAGEIARDIKSGIDALTKQMTGAGMPVAEAQDYANRYAISPLDLDIKDWQSKLRGLRKDLLNVESGVLNARGRPKRIRPPDSGLFIFNPATGKVE